MADVGKAVAGHTATPWEIRHRLNSVGAPNVGGRWVISQTGTSKREDFFIAEMPFAACRSADEKEHAANAAFIVKAVNNHDALVTALTTARDAIASLSMESLGYASAENDQAHWPIRDELLHNIDQALTGAV